MLEKLLCLFTVVFQNLLLVFNRNFWPIGFSDALSRFIISNQKWHFYVIFSFCELILSLEPTEVNKQQIHTWERTWMKSYSYKIIACYSYYVVFYDHEYAKETSVMRIQKKNWLRLCTREIFKRFVFLLLFYLRL